MKATKNIGLLFIASLLISEPSFARHSVYDLSGYRFIDSNEIDGPNYQYTDIKALITLTV